PQARQRVTTGHRIEPRDEGAAVGGSMPTQGLTSPARTPYPLYGSLGGSERDRVGECLHTRPYGGPGQPGRLSAVAAAGFVKLLRLRLSASEQVPFPGPPRPLGGLLRARNFGPTLEAVAHLLAVRGR